MQLGILTKAFPVSTPEEAFRAACVAGYETVQYSMINSGLPPLPEFVSDAEADAVRTASAASGVSISALTAVYNMIHPDLREREQGRRGFRALAAGAHRMGTRMLTVCTGTRDSEDMWRRHPDNASPQAWSDLCAEFARVLEIAEVFDIVIGVEPEMANVISSADKARKLVKEFGSRVRIVLDAANLFEIADADTQRYLVEHAVDLLAESIAIAHAKDRLADGTFCTAGRGVLDYPHYVSVLERAGFDGPLITHGLAAEEAAGVAEFLRSLIV